MARLSFRCSDELVGRVDAARGDVARERWLRRAVERALVDVEGSVRVEAHAPRMSDGRDVDSRPAPAEQPEDAYRAAHGPSGPVPPAFFGSHPASPPREFRPYPKGGKR